MTKPTRAILAIILLAVFLPIPSEISKATKVTFAFTNGRPVAGLKVYQEWECFGMMGSGFKEKITDATGVVEFPSRYGYGSLLGRVFGKLFVLVAVHASYGANISIQFALPNPMRTEFNPPAYKPLQPLATSGSYLGSVGRTFFPPS